MLQGIAALGLGGCASVAAPRLPAALPPRITLAPLRASADRLFAWVDRILSA